MAAVSADPPAARAARRSTSPRSKVAGSEGSVTSNIAVTAGASVAGCTRYMTTRRTRRVETSAFSVSRSGWTSAADRSRSPTALAIRAA